MTKSPEYVLKITASKKNKLLDVELYEYNILILYGTFEILVCKNNQIDLEYISCTEIENGNEINVSPYRFENYIDPWVIYDKCLEAFLEENK